MLTKANSAVDPALLEVVTAASKRAAKKETQDNEEPIPKKARGAGREARGAGREDQLVAAGDEGQAAPKAKAKPRAKAKPTAEGTESQDPTKSICDASRKA